MSVKGKIIKIAAGLLAVCLLAAPASAAENSGEDFGGSAMETLEYLDRVFPGRQTGSETERACGEWLSAGLAALGYQTEEQEFSLPDGRRGRNLAVLKKGKSEKEIILCAHYDSDSATHGADDNGSGVSVALEAAGRLAGEETPCSVRIIFFSGEEEGIYGSQAYVNSLTAEEEQKILCVINLDSLAAGDVRYVHGGIPEEGGVVSGQWLQQYALEISEDYGLEMSLHPGLPGIPAGTRVQGSDQMFFAYRGIPYLYLEASLYSENRGNEKPYRVQTGDARVEKGQIMHSPYDSLAEIERLFPGRTEGHLAAYSRLVWELCTRLNPEGNLEESQEEPETTAAAETEPSSRAPEETSATEQETAEKTEEETGEETETETERIEAAEEKTDGSGLWMWGVGIAAAALMGAVLALRRKKR